MWQLNDEDGLPSMTVYQLLQDTFGFLWFGTEAGLARYDGIEMLSLQTPAAKGAAVSGLQLDSRGNVWFNNFAGQIYKIENGKAVEFNGFESQENLSFNSFLVDKEDNIWLLNANTNRLHKWHKKKSRWHTYELPEYYALINVIKLNNKLIFASNKGILTFNYALDSVVDYNFSYRHDWLHDYIDYNFDGNIFGSGNILMLEEHHNKNLFIAKNDSLYKAYGLPKNIGAAVEVFQDNNNNIWGLFSNGLVTFTFKDTAFFSSELNFLPGRSVSNMMQDRESNYWISTLRSGVYSIPNIQILSYTQETGALPDSRVNTVLAHHNKLLLGLNNGVALEYSPQKGVSFIYKAAENYNVEAILPLENNKILIGNDVFNYHSTKPFAPSSLSNAKCFALLKNHLLIGLEQTCKVIDYQQFKTAKNSIEIENSSILNLRNKRVRTVLADTFRNVIWVAHADGLYSYDTETFEAKPFKKSNTKNHLYAKSLALDSSGTLWVGTLNDGLYGIWGNDIGFHQNEQNGLISNYIIDIEEHKGTLWLGSDKGVQAINPTTNNNKQFTRSDGLLSNEIMDLTILDDNIWVATVRGLNSLPTDLELQNTIKPKIQITGFSILEKDTNLLPNYRLKHNQNYVNIKFIGLSFKSRGKFRYKYRTLGLDSNWLYNQAESRIVRLTALPAGNYQFQVKAVNKDGLESSETATISFSIAQPYWQKWWFYLIIVFLIAAITSLFFIFRIKLLRKNVQIENERNRVALEKSKIEQELRSSQLSMLKVQLNPHFIFNALNSIQDFILLNEGKLANRYLGKFADLMRITLDMSNQNLVSLEDEIKALELYLELEGLRFEDSFTYSLEIDKSVRPKNIEIPALLIQPYVENAIKHGLLHKKENRKLTIWFKLASNDVLLCIVEDNGIGIEASKKINLSRRNHKSFALSANQKRLDLLNVGKNHSIAVEIINLKDHEKAVGTRVILRIPI